MSPIKKRVLGLLHSVGTNGIIGGLTSTAADEAYEFCNTLLDKRQKFIGVKPSETTTEAIQVQPESKPRQIQHGNTFSFKVASPYILDQAMTR